MKQRVWSLILALAMVLSLFPAPVWAEEEGTAVEYLDAAGDPASQSKYTLMTGETQEWNQEWYVVQRDTTISGNVTVSDQCQVNLILCDGATLTINGSVTLYGTEDDQPRLIIYGQESGTGSMKVENTGGYAFSCTYRTAYIRLLGGTLTATGSSAAFSGVACWNEKDYTPNDPVKCVGDPVNDSTVTISKCVEHTYTYHHEGTKHEYYCR